MIHLFKEYNYVQLINQPTKEATTNSTTNTKTTSIIINHVYVNNINNISSFGVLKTIFSDNLTVFVTQKKEFSIETIKEKSRKRNYN